MTVVDYSTLRGVEGYKAAFPNALRGLEGKRLRSVVELSLIHISEPTRPY